MKWFFDWVYRGLVNAERSRQEEREAVIYESPNLINRRKTAKIGLAITGAKVASGSSDGSIHLNQQPMHFKIYPATGGHIVEYTYYNELKDHNDQALHLVPSDLDLGSELAKIMTLEALKR